MNNSFQSLGRCVGPLWAGAAYDMTTTLSFWTGALIQMVALVVSFGMLKTTQPGSASVQPEPAVVAEEV